MCVFSTNQMPPFTNIKFAFVWELIWPFCSIVFAFW
jgi:hypothetical protein